MKPMLNTSAAALLLWLFAAPLQSAYAQPPKHAAMADTKVVLQISDSDPEKQTLVLNVANNLITHYGPDQVALEIVAFGPGLRLLFAGNENKERIQGLMSNNVRFSACANTVSAMSKQLGRAPALNSKAVKVDAGVVRIMDLVKEGYTLVKP